MEKSTKCKREILQKSGTTIMKTTKVFLVLTVLVFLFTQCGMGKFKERANSQFGDQHFKTAIALIERHKTRFGEYPATLDSIKYVGDWDKIIWTSIKYEKLDTGYVLDLTNGWMGMPDSLNYPKDFWNGLGLVKSNMKK
jgi:hypothetical protein